MKKKLLSTVFALAMGVTCTIGFTACGGDDEKDADTASKAVNYIKAQYENKSVDTPETYTVNGVSPVDGELHTVNWSVAKGESCELNDISAYVSVGAMDDKKQVTITIAKAEVEIPYVLTASVTVGKETKSVSFNRKVPAKSAGHAGTLADPYTPSNIKDVAASLNSKWDSTAADQTKSQSYYWPNNDAPTEVYVKGYIVLTGSKIFTDYNTYVGFVYIADEYGTGKSQDDADVVMIMSISYDNNTPLKSVNDIKEGDCITVHGYIQNYFKNSKSDAQPEVSRWKDSAGTYHDVKCDAIVEAEDNRTDAQKAEAALAKVSSTMTVNKTGDTALPVSTEDDVTFTWAVKEGAAATVADGKLIVSALPAEDATVVVTVTAKCGSETKTKDVTVTVKAATEVVPGTTISLAFADKTNRIEFSNTEQIYSENGITFTNSKGNSTTNCGDYVNPVRCYKNSNIKVECASINKIVFHSSAAYTDNNGKVSDYVNWLKTCCENSGVAGITVTISGNDVTVEFASTVTSFEITATEGQLRLMSIDVTT